MKVKIGEKITDSEEEPILLILDSSEKRLIENMGDQTKFCSYPLELSWKPDVIRDFMDIPTLINRRIETNGEHFFGVKRLADTICLLTYQEHPRPECRLFKEFLRKLSPENLQIWMDAPVDKRFNW